MKFLWIFLLLFSANTFGQDDVFIDPQEQAQFPGGYLEFRKFFKANFVYPPDAVEKELSGKCYVQFIVDKEGVCKDFTIKRPVPNCPGCDQEALRLLKLMPKWEPAKMDGKPVQTTFTIPVVFNLE